MKQIKLLSVILLPIIFGVICSLFAFQWLTNSHVSFAECGSLWPISFVIGFFVGFLPSLFLFAGAFYSVSNPQVITPTIENRDCETYIFAAPVFSRVNEKDYSFALNFSL